MQEFFLIIKDWVLELGIQYDVNPIVFGFIYVGAIPLMMVSMGWVIRNYRLHQPILLPVILTTFLYISSYLYLLIAGKNVPGWVYLILCGLISLSLFAMYQSIRRKMREHKHHRHHS